MTNIADSPSTPATPPTLLSRHVQLETDHFCDCGYNLHGQRVTRDERLDFMVVRCPECGRFHPAGHGVAARSLWLGRFATFMLVAWLLGLVTFFLAAGFALAMWVAISVMDGTTYGQFTTQGQPIEYRVGGANGNYSQYIVGTDTVYTGQVTSRYVPRPLNEYWEQRGDQLVGVLVVAQLNAFLVGAVATVASWHVSRRRLLLWLAFPFLCAAVAWLLIVFFERVRYGDIYSWLAWRFVVGAAIECVGLLLGLELGRALARGLANTFIPPKARQAMAFLWYADGKTPPPAALPAKG